MALRGTDPETYITEYPLVYKKNSCFGCWTLRRTANIAILGKEERGRDQTIACRAPWWALQGPPRSPAGPNMPLQARKERETPAANVRATPALVPCGAQRTSPAGPCWALQAQRLQGPTHYRDLVEQVRLPLPLHNLARNQCI
jgi:hypothetical protein